LLALDKNASRSSLFSKSRLSGLILLVEVWWDSPEGKLVVCCDNTVGKDDIEISEG
jgi:hypothetical protein